MQIKINKKTTKEEKKPIKVKKEEKVVKDKKDYSAKDIYVLEGLEPVRRRPGMYIGSTGVSGLHHLIWEVFDNSIDEALGGFCDNIQIELLENNRVSILDNGRGIPVDYHNQSKKSALETVLTTLHAGGKFGGESYKISGGLHGVGVSVVNALSVYLKAEVYRDGYIYMQEYSKGKPTSKLSKVKNTTKIKHGTRITFEPDSTIMQEISFNWKTILDHIREQAYLVKKIKIDLTDKRNKEDIKNYTFYFENGIVAFLNYLIKDHETKNIHKNLFYVNDNYEGIDVEIALSYVNEIETSELAFANNIHTPEGGMHLTGFRTALTRVLNTYLKKNYAKEKLSLTGDDVREGLMTIISVKIREPQFEGQTKAKLGNPEARVAVDQVMSKAFLDFLEKNPDDVKKILEKCLVSAKARSAAKLARENVLRKSIMEHTTLPGKLADCISRKAEESELFIVEGDSAGGSGKQGRDRHTQAILPLRGKILNVEKARLDKMMANEEIKAIILALGTSISEDFNLDKIRYHKIILMTDADVDGSHIRTLLLTLFYRYFFPLVEKGYLYAAQPPLYRIQKGKIFRYAYTEEEKEKVIDEILKLKEEKEDKKEKEEEIEEVDEAVEVQRYKGIIIQRYKGLGEMNPDQLWETTMNPETRILKQITIEDAKEADRLFDILMGEERMPRKKFIQAYAKKVKNLDV